MTIRQLSESSLRRLTIGTEMVVLSSVDAGMVYGPTDIVFDQEVLTAAEFVFKFKEKFNEQLAREFLAQWPGGPQL